MDLDMNGSGREIDLEEKFDLDVNLIWTCIQSGPAFNIQSGCELDLDMTWMWM